MGERDQYLIGAAGAGGEEDGFVLSGGLDEKGEDFAQAGGEGQGAAQRGGVRRAGIEQGEEVEDEKLERARNADAILPPARKGRSARADRRRGLFGSD